MAIFLRGNIWWYEYKTTRIRVVKSTGFRKEDKKKAEAAFAAFKLGIGAKPKRSAMEEMLKAIYETDEKKSSFPVESIWLVYEDWLKSKARIMSPRTLTERKSRFNAFLKFAQDHKIKDIDDITVAFARQFATSLAGRANKTIRNRIQDLSTIWEAISQLRPGVFNPWKAACPDNDGSGRRRDFFTEDERERVFASCKIIGHDWYNISMIACYTGLRYGDVATLEWGSAEEALRKQVLDNGIVDRNAGLIVVMPNKTKRHGTRVTLPVSTQIATILNSYENTDGFLFPEHALKYQIRDKISPSFADVLRHAQIKGYHDFHSWRHTFRSMLAAAGVSDETARRMGGWTNLAMAAHYDHDPHIKEMKSAIDAISSSSGSLPQS